MRCNPKIGAPSWTCRSGCGAWAFEQYEATFRDNAIDDGVLPDLTDQDLEKLGILLGHRRKLLRAIANIQTAPSAADATAAVFVSPRDTAERRQVTVMF